MSDLVLYGGFAAVVAALLAVDLFVVHRDAHAVSLREAATWSAIWIGVAIIFGLLIPALHEGSEAQPTIAYFTGYVIEKSLSVDNVFLFVLIFSALSVPREYQHRVLFYGVLGAIVMRTILIFTGAALIERFSWILYLFGAFLIYTGIHTWLQRESHPDVADSKLLHRIRKVLPTTDSYRGDKFFVVENGRRLATPMFVVLVLVEFTDLIFAMDSIPAIFAVTQDPFIVLTSNVFAILGLRALYFLLAGVADKLRYLKAGLAVILVFVGLKLVYEQLHEQVDALHDYPGVAPVASLLVIMAILAVSVIASLRHPLAPGEEPPSGVGPFDEMDSGSSRSTAGQSSGSSGQR